MRIFLIIPIAASTWQKSGCVCILEVFRLIVVYSVLGLFTNYLPIPVPREHTILMATSPPSLVPVWCSTGHGMIMISCCVWGWWMSKTAFGPGALRSTRTIHSTLIWGSCDLKIFCSCCVTLQIRILPVLYCSCSGTPWGNVTSWEWKLPCEEPRTGLPSVTPTSYRRLSALTTSPR